MPFEYKTPPMSQQRMALNKFARGLPRQRGAGAFLMEQGTGKTYCYVVEAAYLYEQGEIDTLVIISRNGVHRQIIEQEVPRHLPDRIRHEAHAYSADSTNTAMWKSLQKVDRLLILAFNVQSLSTKSTFQNVLRTFFVEKAVGGNAPRPTRPRKVMVVIDESHEIRTPSSKRSKNAWALGRRAVVRRIGTGTEMGKGWENLYSQFRFLDPDIIGEHTYTAFKTKYCRERGEFGTIYGYKNIEELKALIEPYVFVCEKKDCMDLPRQNFLDSPPTVVYLTPEQKRLMKDLKDNYVTQLDSGELVEAPMAISRLQKFQQIAGGHIKLPDGSWQPVPNGSLDAALNIVSQVHGRFIVWAQWQPDILQLQEVLGKAGISAVSYFGGNSDKENAHNLSLFKGEAVQGLLATYGKGSAGLDLPGVDDSLYYTLTFDPIDYWQSLSRNHRKGTTRVVNYYFLHRPGSTDAKLLTNLKARRVIADMMRDPAIFKTWMDAIGDENPAHDEVLSPRLKGLSIDG
jgi:hypothetical protein